MLIKKSSALPVGSNCRANGDSEMWHLDWTEINSMRLFCVWSVGKFLQGGWKKISSCKFCTIIWIKLATFSLTWNVTFWEIKSCQNVPFFLQNGCLWRCWVGTHTLQSQQAFSLLPAALLSCSILSILSTHFQAFPLWKKKRTETGESLILLQSDLMLYNSRHRNYSWKSQRILDTGH